MSSKTCLQRRIYGHCYKTKQIKRGLRGSMHTLATRESRMEVGKRDSSPSSEKREWHTDENGARAWPLPLIQVRWMARKRAKPYVLSHLHVSGDWGEWHEWGGGNPSLTTHARAALLAPTHLAPREPGPGEMRMELALGEPGSKEPFAPHGPGSVACPGYQTRHTCTMRPV
jgi:hypothetical protein